MRFDPCVFKNQASGSMYKPALHRDLSRIRGINGKDGTELACSFGNLTPNIGILVSKKHQICGFELAVPSWESNVNTILCTRKVVC